MERCSPISGMLWCAVTYYTSDAQISGARSPWRLNLYGGPQYLLIPQYGICFISPFWRLEFWRGSWNFGKFVHPCTNILCTRKQDQQLSVISGFRRDVDEICTLLGYYAASSGNLLPTFRVNVAAPSLRALDFLTLDDGTDTLPRNVGEGLYISQKSADVKVNSQ
jgi:hypothetical protein